MRFPGLVTPVLIVAFLVLLFGCSTGGLTEAPAESSGGGTTGGTATPASIDLLVSSPQLSSDMVSAPTVTLTAIVKDSGNRAIQDQAVTFSADSGVIGDIGATTDTNGMVTAKLGAGGDPTYRTITVSAAAGSLSATNSVVVTGTQITIDPSSFSMLSNDPLGKQLTISLKDSAGKGIDGKTVTLTSASGESTFAASTYVTDNSGQITVTVKHAGDTVGDTIAASAIGVSAQAALTINTAKLAINAPAANAQVAINTSQPFTVTYTKNDIPVAGQTIYFTTTRGSLTPPFSGVTAADGSATVNVLSLSSGPAVLTAYTTDGTTEVSTQSSIIFVADTADKMALSADPAVINTNASGMTSEQSLIKAIVRDPLDNLVMGKVVVFGILHDTSAGSLTKGSATTDMYGTATTNYIAGGVNSGVTINATVRDTPAVTAATTLTVGGQALFISLATGPDIQKIDPNKYQKDYVAVVTDAYGGPVQNAVVTATVTPLHYYKGYYYLCGAALDKWCQMRTLVASKSTLPSVPACANEDGITQNLLYDFNGILDSGEDQNANSRLDPGNVASVTATTTDSTGHSTISLVYARDYAYWVNVKLEVRGATLVGSTTSAFQTFDLPGAGEDYADKDIPPPGSLSPFGSNTTCYATLSVLALSDTKISLNWDPSAYASSYNIYRDQNDGAPAILIQNITKTIYEDTVTAGTTYCYEIKQVNSSGSESPLSPVGNRVCAASQPTAPTGVTATALSPTQIQVSWGDAGAAGYRIYKDGIAVQDSVTRSIVSGSLSANTQYCYAVASLDSSGSESAKSSPSVCATTSASSLPSVPTGLTISSTVAGQVDLSWAVQAPAPWGYKIYKDSVFFMSAQGTLNTISDTSATSDTVSCYAVSAFDVNGNESAQSGQVCISVK